MTAMTTIRSGSLYASTAKFDGSARALTDEEMFKAAPSIFATAAHDSRSAKFKPIATIDVLHALQGEGFSPVAVMQGGSRDPSKRDFTKHMIRLRRLHEVEKYRTGDSVYEMILKNANDGSAAYDLMGGLFRILCLNSLVAQTSTQESVRVRHLGKHVEHDVIDATYQVVQGAQLALEAPAIWGGINLSGEEQRVFASAAHVARFADAEGKVTTAIEPAQLLRPRRAEDDRSDLWTTFNRVQENAIKGGLTGYGRDANNNMRRRTTREVRGIDENVKLNKALWTLGTEMAKLKQAA
jgi:hypothetical protein